MNNHLTYEELKPLLDKHADTKLSLTEFIEYFPMVSYYKIGDILKTFGETVVDFVAGREFIIHPKFIVQVLQTCGGDFEEDRQQDYKTMFGGTGIYGVSRPTIVNFTGVTWHE